jgi:hypothetical protein
MAATVMGEITTTRLHLNTLTEKYQMMMWI